ncbi:histamine N-methyltransferase-like [Glandiceps talaboti]
MDKEMIPLTDDRDHYHRCQIVHTNHTDRVQKLKQACSTTIPQAICDSVLSDPKTKRSDTLRLLSLGSGSGEAELQALIHLRKTFPNIHATIVEPAAESLAEFKGNVGENHTSLDGVMFEWQQMTWEDYVGDKETVGPFDCILLLGVITYFSEPMTTMRYLYTQLAEHGVIVLNILSENNGSDYVRKNCHFLQKFTPARITTTEVVACFKGIKANVKVSEVKGSRDITPILQQDSDTGSRLLDNICHVVNFRQTADREHLDTVMKLLQDPEIRVPGHKDQVKIVYNTDIIIVSKDGNMSES